MYSREEQASNGVGECRSAGSAGEYGEYTGGNCVSTPVYLTYIYSGHSLCLLAVFISLLKAEGGREYSFS